MPTRQMKDTLEQHLVIKPQVQVQVQTSRNHQVHSKNQKVGQTGKGPQPPFEPSSHQHSPPTKNRGRRRGRGSRKSDQIDIPLRPSSRPCTLVDKSSVSLGSVVAQPVENISRGVENGGQVCAMDMGFPSSSKALRFAPRPGFGTAGIKCVVKANHFFAQLPDKDLHQYDVTVTPEVASRPLNRCIMAELVKLYKESDLGRVRRIESLCLNVFNTNFQS